MRFLTSLIGLIAATILLAQEPPVVKVPSKNDDEKAKLKLLILELEDDENNTKLKLAHKKECEKIIKDNCFSCHNFTTKNSISFFNELNEVVFDENKDELIKFLKSDKNIENCKKLEEKQKTRLLKFFDK
jgi:hypothetical protein